ncbi:MAG: T9SS type A sorting domain-containing protein [Flavobacteriales bacterium]|nr:T9SS type A sorting domain-containing protein [Flavobacteriales bacterium]
MKIFTISFIFLFAGFTAFSQCVPSTGFTGSGVVILPAQLEPVFACAGCGDHERILSIRTFADTLLSVELNPNNRPLPVTVFADRFRLDSIAGLPEGLTYTTDVAFDSTYDALTDPFGNWLNGGDTTIGFTEKIGCISINGSAANWTLAANGGPNNDGLYPLTIFLDARVAKFDPAAISQFVELGTWLSDMGVLLESFGDTNFTENGIRYTASVLDVRASALGISDVSSGEFTSLNVFPNPISGSAVISFGLKQNVSDIEFNVFDALGSLIRVESLSGSVGQNTFDFSTHGLAVGIYTVSLSSGRGILTKRVIVR